MGFSPKSQLYALKEETVLENKKLKNILCECVSQVKRQNLVCKRKLRMENRISQTRKLKLNNPFVSYIVCASPGLNTVFKFRVLLLLDLLLTKAEELCLLCYLIIA